MLYEMGNESQMEGPASYPSRRRWSVGEKQQMVEESLTPGTSVVAVAARHRVSASQVYRWRRQYRGGTDGANHGPALLPVKLTETRHSSPVERGLRKAGPSSGSLQLEVGNARLLVDEAADPGLLRLMLNYLLG